MQQPWQPGGTGTCFPKDDPKIDSMRNYYPLFAIWLSITTDVERAAKLRDDASFRKTWAESINMRPECLGQFIDDVIAHDDQLTLCSAMAGMFVDIVKTYCAGGCHADVFANIAALATQGQDRAKKAPKEKVAGRLRHVRSKRDVKDREMRPR